MIEILTFRLAGPLMSFGDVAIDERGPTAPFPMRSMVAGLLANALGWTHRDMDRLSELQEGLRVAARADHPGRLLRDYQTVDLSQPFLAEPGWTTRGVVEQRAGGGAKEGTTQRQRWYLADAGYTVFLTWPGEDAADRLDTLADALQRPVRPLFLGRKPCLPSEPLGPQRRSAQDIVSALVETPLWHPLGSRWRGARAREGGSNRRRAWWPVDLAPPTDAARIFPAASLRDWHNRVHVGAETMVEAWVEIAPNEAKEDPV